VRKKPQFDILPPNDPEGHHDRRGERIERKTIEIGKGEWNDFLTHCTVVECHLRIVCGARSVNLFNSTFERCTFDPRRELKNLPFSGITLRDCTFLGKYCGCRFGNEDEDDACEVRGCDFSQAKLFHLCDFLDGVDVGSLRWPPWPHIAVTDLPQHRKQWLRLKLPKEMRIVQDVIGDDEMPCKACTLYLPAETDHLEELRPLLAAQHYITIS
jgi:hypothetical protein